MDSEKKQARKPNPRTDANIFSKLTFWYNKELFKKSFRKELKKDDLYEVIPDFETSALGDQFETEWELHKNKKNAMFLVFWNIFGKYYCLLFLTTSINIFVNVFRPILLGTFVSYFSPEQTTLTKANAFFYGSLLILLQIIQIIWMHNYHFAVEILSVKVRTGIGSLIYRKILKFPASRLRCVSFGQITNLITKDINVFDRCFNNFSQACSGVIATIVICYHLYQTIGLPAVVAIVVFALFSIFQVCMGAWTASIRKLSSDKTDSRIALLQEVLSNIRSIKLYALEKYLERKITGTRREEILVLLKMFKVLIATVVTATIINCLTFYLVVLPFIWFDRILTAETIYYINGAFIGLQYYMVTALPYGTFYFSQVIAAIKRMQVLILKLEVYDKNSPSMLSVIPNIKLEQVVLKLDKTNLKVSGTITKGLTLVTGPTGSGKSAFFLAILKEFDLVQGELITEGRISYASQEPWLFPSTIKQNIIFGSDYNEHRYRKVVEVCALEYDFDRLEMGDATVVADNGFNLSRGQQSRINLARAIYKDCEIYLLDDCLSSLDSIVSHYIFTNCILNYLNDKMVLLITHNSSIIPYATEVLNISNGNVKFCKNLESTKLLEQVTEKKGFKLEIEEREKDEKCNPESKLLTSKQENEIYAEENKKGAVSCHIFKTYVRLGGGFSFCLLILAVFTATQLSLSYKDKLISDWANLEDRISQLNETKLNASDYDVLSSDRKTFFYKYTFSVITLSLCTLIRAWMLFIFTKRVSINLHAKILKSVCNAVLKFFDLTFIGNIVNRFSKDLIVVDEDIPFFLLHFTAILCETIGNLVLIFFTNVKLVVPITFLLITIFFLRFTYLKNGRPLKRLDAITKSPVVGYLNSTMKGLATIKVFNAEIILKDEFERRHNVYNSATYSYISCLKAFVFLVDLCASIFIAILILQFIIFDRGVSSGDVGLAVSQVFIMTGVLYYVVLMEAGIQTQMTSVERALEYTHIENEPEEGLVLTNWPKKAEIRYTNVCFSVNNSFILKNINFVIKSREKIGIVGRTGAGKSSIISALFRLYETSGKITIDGVDIKTLSLNFLRNKISVVPQDPMFLEGSLRDNIDPNKKYSDEDIWSALEKIHLKTVISDLSVSTKKLNLSSGEKQLFCLAKILLSDNKILILDEMVENVDLKTEELISQIIDRNFASATVIKIAHTLRFVMNCDKILVLNRGEIVEFDHPSVLLANQNSVFYEMVQKSSND